MEKLELNHKVENGKLVLDLPEEFNDLNVHVTISKVVGNNGNIDNRKWLEIPIVERSAVLKKYFGKAKYPDFPIDKFDVYDQ